MYVSKSQKTQSLFNNRKNENIDYRNIYTLRKFITIQGKIIAKRITKLNTKQQRQLTKSM